MNEQAAAAETLDGESITLMSRLARELRIHIVAGSITEQVAGDATIYNTSALLGPDGGRIARLSQDSSLRHRSARPRDGAASPPRKLAGAEVVYCRDSARRDRTEHLLRPALPGTLSPPHFCRRANYRVPSCFTFPTGEAHWESLLRARAIENQAYVIAPAQFGPNVHGFSDYGNSMIVDPWGRVLARAADQEGVVVAPIDLDYQERVRHELPALKHARLHGDRE